MLEPNFERERIVSGKDKRKFFFLHYQEVWHMLSAMKTQQFWWLSMITFYCLFLCNHIFVVSGLCLEDQQSLLLQLKKNITFKSENSDSLVSWDQNISCCQWSGITCGEDGHVTGLDLSGEMISFGLDNSSSLFSLQNLQVLNLAYNMIDFVIPYGFKKLKNLTYLNLSNAGFMEQIPIEISHLTRLVTLDLSELTYSHDDKLDLQKLVQNLTRIRHLYLDGITMSAQGKEWSNALLLMPSLHELSIIGCDLSGPLDSSLTRLKNLSVIRLQNNNLSSPVPETFANFPNLTILDLSYCGLIGIFPKKIFQVPTLSFIDISSNVDLYGSLPDFQFNPHLRSLIVRNTLFSGAVPVSISNLSRLSTLSLSNCQFNGTLPNSMSKLTELTDLDLSFNHFSGTILPLYLFKNLCSLDLSHNDLTGSFISAHLEGLRKLESINLSSNKLEGPIPSSISHLRSLVDLQLSSNKFNGTIHLDMFRRLENLTALDLSHNNLSVDTNVEEIHVSSFPKMSDIYLASCNLIEFPRFLRNQSRLINLDLSSNHIQGSIPSWIWQFGSLATLNLSHNLLTTLERPVQNLNIFLMVLDLQSNQLQGELPVFPLAPFYFDISKNNFSSSIPSNFIANLVRTGFISLSKNNLHGSIPQSLCNASFLGVLDVSYNSINGTIPECLLQIESLRVLNLKNNMLSGNIPDGFPKSCALRTLDLNRNQLGGKIPKSLANCTPLEVLDLGNNCIGDEFPRFLMNLSSLRAIILRKNKFRGPIGCPKTNGTWQKLQIIDLAFNSFSGLLPGKCFKSWEAMILDEDHDVSESDHIQFQNLTVGPIYYDNSLTLTNKGQLMTFDKILIVFTSIDLSSNNLEGPVPEELMNFSGLHVLNLSHNAFTGHIPSSIGNLKQLESLDLSCNHFDGTIPTQLATLNFLSYLNLSFNQLMGKIPTGTQIQSFDASSFEDNDGLYGPPLTESLDDLVPMLSPHGRLHAIIEWEILSVEFGLIFGLGLVIGPLLFWKQWRLWYWKRVDKILCCIFPQLHIEYISQGGEMYQVLRWGH